MGAEYLVDVKVRERLAGNKQKTRKFDMETFNFKKIKWRVKNSVGLNSHKSSQVS
jgi:hypothetical protein